MWCAQILPFPLFPFPPNFLCFSFLSFLLPSFSLSLSPTLWFFLVLLQISTGIYGESTHRGAGVLSCFSLARCTPSTSSSPFLPSFFSSLPSFLPSFFFSSFLPSFFPLSFLLCVSAVLLQDSSSISNIWGLHFSLKRLFSPYSGSQAHGGR